VRLQRLVGWSSPVKSFRLPTVLRLGELTIGETVALALPGCCRGDAASRPQVGRSFGSTLVRIISEQNPNFISR